MSIAITHSTVVCYSGVIVCVCLYSTVLTQTLVYIHCKNNTQIYILHICMLPTLCA
jgi:hypothetical protein